MQYTDTGARTRLIEAKTTLLNLTILLTLAAALALGIPLAVLLWKAAF